MYANLNEQEIVEMDTVLIPRDRPDSVRTKIQRLLEVQCFFRIGFF